MRLVFAVVFLIALSFLGAARADAPATAFFVVETAKLTKLASTDVALDTLTETQLSEISVASGWYDGGLAMVFTTPTFRLDARFDGAAEFRSSGPASIIYFINASNDRKSWSLVSVEGKAVKQGKQFITEDWRKQPVTVILRHLHLKD